MKWVLIIVGVIIVLGIVGAIASIGEKEESTKPEVSKTSTEEETTPEVTSPKAQAPDISEFEPVGFFDNRPAMYGISYYVTSPTKADIKALCDEMKVRYIDTGLTTNLQVDFFDNLENTPDFKTYHEDYGYYYFPDSCEPYHVANYYYNANNNATRLLFLKDIPD
ncbi:MAG: hypothetical protein PHP64_02415 [Actinomycetota bacterium]|nr:hypothetical protein [Actinomycetota bacterium]